ncbi:hypothetical protein FPCIR_1556 [Fusarium pseudocircinatum]|uniref:LITAF domain-containing protein n=1 Tax=Fusarium pseudocircinatum TaxID=56676 RepID=A0A8H5PUZ0_9HYPO|nr:hypothetical protein FPCIR_1556 [Fusarium pseudocircinatum]
MMLTSPTRWKRQAYNNVLQLQGQVIRTVVHDEGLPEVVHSNQPINPTEYYDAPIPVDSETDKRYNEAPIPVTTLDKYEPAPPLPVRPSSITTQPQQPYPYGSNSYAQPQHSGFVAQSPQLPFLNSNEVVTVSATVLGFTTIAGAAVPYVGKWHSHTAHYCSICDHKVAIRKWGSNQMKPQGTPDHLREVSKYGPAHSPSMSSSSTRG